jgi:hypothetical protein
MFGPAGNNNFGIFYIGKTYGVANSIAPGSGAGTHYYGIINAFCYFINKLGLRIWFERAVGIKIGIVKGYKFKKNTIIKHHFHGCGIGLVLKSNKSLRRQIGINSY